jgi:hypothetical protein
LAVTYPHRHARNKCGHDESEIVAGGMNPRPETGQSEFHALMLRRLLRPILILFRRIRRRMRGTRAAA